MSSSSGHRSLISAWKKLIETESISIYHSSFVSMDQSSLYFQVMILDNCLYQSCALSILKWGDSAPVFLMNLNVVAWSILCAVFNPIFSN